jgi:hypothetical protein
MIELPTLLNEQKHDKFCQEITTWLEGTEPVPFQYSGFIKRFSFATNGLLLYNNFTSQLALVIPANTTIPQLQPLSLLQHFHDQTFNGHFGFQKTKKLIIQHVYWKTMDQDIKTFLQTCHQCQLAQPQLHLHDGLLHPLPIPDERFETLHMDFAPMPKDATGPNNLLVLVCKFTKLTIAIPCSTTITAEDTAHHIFTHWFLRGYGFPKYIYSDHDPLFVSNTFKTFSKLTNILHIPSTARHQRTDGLAEAHIKQIKLLFKKTVDYKQNNWVYLLPQILFAINNTIHSSTHFSPYYLAHAFQPQTLPIFDFSNLPKTPLHDSFQKYNTNLLQVTQELYNQQTAQIKKYDRQRTHPPTYKLHDFVLLNRDGIKWAADSQRDRKLLPPHLGPFKIIHIDHSTDNYTLDLPPYLSQIHPTFHIQLLTPYHFDQVWQRNLNAEPEPEIDPDTGDETYVLDTIIDVKKYRNTFKFLVSWKGWGPEHNTWILLNELQNAQEALTEFHTNNPTNIAFNQYPSP